MAADDIKITVRIEYGELLLQDSKREHAANPLYAAREIEFQIDAISDELLNAFKEIHGDIRDRGGEA